MKLQLLVTHKELQAFLDDILTMQILKWKLGTNADQMEEEKVEVLDTLERVTRDLKIKAEAMEKIEREWQESEKAYHKSVFG